MDLIKHPSADQAVFNLDELDSWVRERSHKELDIFASGAQDVTGDISVYSKVNLKSENGSTSVSNLEAPSVKIRSKKGDITLNSIKIANSVLGESIDLKSESGNIFLNGRTVGDVKAHTDKGNIQAGTLQSLTIDLRGKEIFVESAYAGDVLVRASGSTMVKNVNGNIDIESAGRVLLDGCDGELRIMSGDEVDVHLDSSLKSANIVSNVAVIIRTAPDQNKHTFSVTADEIEVNGFTDYSQRTDGPTTTINLGGENTAGHPRKVASIDFGGVIDVTAPSVAIQAESWFQKMANQKKRFPAKKTAADSQFRFY